MDVSLLDQASDPSDWTGDWTALRPLDESLRCGLCYVRTMRPAPGLTQDIYRAPVALRECAHLFCSACIRMHINQPGGAGTFCPQCRQKKAYDAELVAQPALENAANAWRAARYVKLSQILLYSPFLMSQWHMLQKRENEVHQVIENKRKAETSPSERRLRPRTRHVAETPEPEDVDYRALDSAHIVQCPICFGSFDAVALNKHLDEGCGGPSAAGPSSAPPASMDAWLGNKHSSLWEGARRLTRPQYQLKSERDLRKMLDVCCVLRPTYTDPWSFYNGPARPPRGAPPPMGEFVQCQLRCSSCSS